MLTRLLTARIMLHNASTILGVDSATTPSNGTGVVRLPYGSGVSAQFGGAPTTVGQSYDYGVHRYR